MKTASFQTYTGPGRISIARFAPRGTPKGYRQLKALAPGQWFNSVSEGQYVQLFDKEILGVLSAKKIFDECYTMAAGAEPVLLCWEKPTDPIKNPDAYCHRALVAKFFFEKLGVVVDELGYEGKEHPLLPRAMRGQGSQSTLF